MQQAAEFQIRDGQLLGRARSLLQILISGLNIPTSSYW